MNLLDCRVDAAGETFLGPVTYPADDTLAAAADSADGRDVTLGVRPEVPTLLGPEGGHDGPTFPGEVDVVEPVGERSFVYVTLEAGPQLVVAVAGGTPVRERAPVRVRIPRDGLHVFDGTSETALHHPDWRDTETVALSGGIDDPN